MRLRGYCEGDLERMYQLDVACFAAAYQFDRAMMQEAVEAAGAIVAVMEDGQAICGFAIAHREEDWAYLVTIDVEPGARRAGVGARLLQEIERQAGSDGVWLHVAADNRAAIAFYERQGYRRVGVEKGFYREARTDGLVYAKACRQG